MPRIAPLQLLTCLTVLLMPNGGILSREEVPRLVNLMTKFSKKLVSKCVYILILKSTERSLVDLFMAEGGWNLIHTWLQDAIQVSNWDLVKEILGLLLITPVDVERLKLNNIPKMVKNLSRNHTDKGVEELSSQLVHDWLVIVKSNSKSSEDVGKVKVEVIKTADVGGMEAVKLTDTVDSSQIKPENISGIVGESIPTSTFYKVTVRDGKQVISRTPIEGVSESDSTITATDTTNVNNDEVENNTEIKEDVKGDPDKKSSDKSKSKSSSSRSSSKHSSSSRSKSSSSSSNKDRHKSSSSKSSSSRDKSKDRKDKHRDKHKANGDKSSSSSGKDKSEQKEKQAEKDKDTLAKIKPQSIDKLGRIPKKTDEKSKENKEVKKPTMSIEVRKNNEERPKTVKVFNSKRRSTGLEEEAKPPPPRPVKKPPVQLPTIPPKRPSPIRDFPTPPEKKLKVEIPERPGAIKLIPPKPKPPVLQESDIFMDALTASATTKKEPKKRKRRLSVSKDVPESPTTSQEPSTPTSPVSSPLGLKNIAAPNFYQDTLNTDQNSDIKVEIKEEIKEERPTTPMETDVDIKVDIKMEMKTEGGLKGVLVYTKKRGPKKSVKFNDNNLTQVRFFELDETERVNVTKTFMDMAKMDMTSEREALEMSRKLSNEDVMEAITPWKYPFIIDQSEPLAVPGCKSLEKDIQFAREKSVHPALYFDKRKIPDSPEEPIPENHQMSDPIVIPLEDAESQEMDLRNTPWPEPKGSPPHQIQENIPPQIFQNMPMPFQNFPHGAPPPFQGMPPRFGPPNGPPGVFSGPPNMLPNGNMMGPPPDMIHQGPLNPNAFGPGPDNFNPMMNDNNFPMPFNPPNMGMFPPNNFNMNRGGGGGRGGFRRGGGGNNNGPWIRMNGPGNWNNRGGGGGRGRFCKNIKNHGFCRNMDKCPFIHPK